MNISSAFVSVLVMLAFMGAGFLLSKAKKVQADHAKSLSGILVYLCSPCLILSSFQAMENTAENTKHSGLFFLISLAVQLLFFLILFLLFRKKYTDARYRILSVGGILGNVGFFGLPLVQGLFPNEPIVSCYSTVYILSMNLIIFTVGVFLITLNRKFISLKAAVLNPTVLSFAVAFPLYLLNFHFPDAVGSAISLLGKMSTPLCMIVLGMRLSSMNPKEIFADRFSYFCCAVKLLIFPLFAYLCVFALPFLDNTFKVCLTLLSGAPSGAIVLSLSELHGCEQKASANAVLLTTILCLATVPLLVFLFC